MKMTKPVARATYMFKGDLMADPKVMSTVLRNGCKEGEEGAYVTVVESLPVKTFRAGAITRDVKNAYNTLEEAEKGHLQLLGGVQ